TVNNPELVTGEALATVQVRSQGQTIFFETVSFVPGQAIYLDASTWSGEIQVIAVRAGSRAGGVGDTIVCNPPSDPDSDGDGVPDSEDAFADDPTAWSETDDDGVGDNSDACPGVYGEDGHGCPVVTDPDSDGDGVPDSE